MLRPCRRDCATAASWRDTSGSGWTQATAGGTLTGIPEVDLWIRSINPTGVTQPALIYSPNVQTGRVQTWP